MNKEIIESLELELGLPCFYIHKKNSKEKEYIIFSYSELPNKFSDDEESLTQILVFMNLYYKGNFTNIKTKIVSKMKELGYIKKSIPNAFWEDDLQVYNQAFQFIKLKDGELNE